MTVVIIDLDGTIIPSVARKAMKRCCDETGISPEVLSRAISNTSELETMNTNLFKGCMNIFIEEIVKAEPISETIEALKSLPSDVPIIISSRAPEKAIEWWLKRNNLEVFLHFGRGDGEKKLHIIKALMRTGEYKRVIFVANEPSDFNIDEVTNGIEVKKIAVNVNPNHRFPKGTCVYTGPLTKRILSEAIGG